MLGEDVVAEHVHLTARVFDGDSVAVERLMRDVTRRLAGGADPDRGGEAGEAW
jgi:hypothetical protein